MVQEKLAAIFREIFANDKLTLTETSSPNDVEGWDSLSQVMIVEEAEKTFGIKMDLDEVFEIKTFGDFVKNQLIGYEV